jgi:hypothetical protein
MGAGGDSLNLAAMAAFIDEKPLFTLGFPAFTTGVIFFCGIELETMGTLQRDLSKNQKRQAGKDQKRAHQLELWA